MKKFKEYLGEAFFKVKIPDVAPTFVEAGSASQVKASMRKIMKPDVIKELEIESTQIASALSEQGSSIRAVIDEVEERKGELNEKFAAKLKDLEGLVVPMLKGLMANADKEYIYWPNRTPILEKQIEKVYSITRPE